MQHTIDDIRRLNLLILLAEAGGKRKVLAERGETNPAYISQLLTKNQEKRREIGDVLARRLERNFNKPYGWMDVYEPDSHMYDWGEEYEDDETAEGAKQLTPSAVWAGEFDLWDEATPLRDDEVALNFFREVELAAGSGRVGVQENHGLKLRFAKSTLKKKGVLIENAVCVTASGNSMEPVIPDGTTLGIDRGCTKIVNGEIYAIDHDGHLRVKMVYQMPGGIIRLRSFNSDEWPDEIYSGENASTIKILGRVFWWSVLR